MREHRGHGFTLTLVAASYKRSFLTRENIMENDSNFLKPVASNWPLRCRKGTFETLIRFAYQTLKPRFKKQRCVETRQSRILNGC